MARLGDIATYVNGYAFKPSDWSDKGIPIIRIQDLTGNSYQLNRYEGKYDKKYEVGFGDVLISWSASLGVYIWKGEKAVLNQHIFKVVFDKEAVDKDFFVYQVQNTLEKALEKTHGATMKHLTKPVFDSLPFYLPSFDEQKRITSILNKTSDMISLRKQQLDKLDELVKSRFVEVFGNPIVNDRGWKTVCLAACVESIDSGTSFICGSTARQGNWPAVLKLSAATYGIYRPGENKAMIDDSQFIESAAVRPGDLLFTRKNTPELVGMCAYVYDTPEKLMMPDLIFRLNTKPECNKIYLWKLINHDLFRDCIEAIATGSAKSMSNISKERLLSLKIILPPNELQDQFATFVTQVDKSKLTIQQSLDKLEMLKKALMQKYFG